MDYSTLLLQTSDNPSQKALLYSKNKRPLLLESEKSHTPVKIARFTYMSEGDKIIINDMTKVSFPSQNEYAFQYEEQPSTPAKSTPIADILSSSSEWDCVTLYGKAVYISASNVVSTNLQVAEVIFADNSGIIKVDLWEENISKVEVGKVYQISPIQVRVWSNAKKLSTIISSVITLIPDDQSLQEVHVSKEQIELMTDTIVLKVPNIHLVEKIEHFIQCVKCSRKILQAIAKRVVSCDRCGGIMRLADCPKQICAKIVVRSSDNKELHLTAFEPALRSAIIGELHSLTESEVGEMLLLLENITITYNATSMLIAKLS